MNHPPYKQPFSLVFTRFHSFSLKSSNFLTDFNYKITIVVRKTPDATTWFRLEKSAIFLKIGVFDKGKIWFHMVVHILIHVPFFSQIRDFSIKNFQKISRLSLLQKMQKMADLSLCALGGFPYKSLRRFYWGPFAQDEQTALSKNAFLKVFLKIFTAWKTPRKSENHFKKHLHSVQNAEKSWKSVWTTSPQPRKYLKKLKTCLNNLFTALKMLEKVENLFEQPLHSLKNVEKGWKPAWI